MRPRRIYPNLRTCASVHADFFWPHQPERHQRHQHHFADKNLVPALTVFLASFALFAVTGAPAWAQRTYDRLPIVKEGTTVRISPHVYVIPDENARGAPNVGIIVGSRATLVVDPGMGLKSGQAVVRVSKASRGHEHPGHTP